MKVSEEKLHEYAIHTAAFALENMKDDVSWQTADLDLTGDQYTMLSDEILSKAITLMYKKLKK